MSPAEKISREKFANRKPRKTKPSSIRRVWLCQCATRRVKLGLSIKDAAKAVGMSQTGLWQVEQGADPMLTTAMKLAKFYGTKIEELWKQ